MAEIDTTEWWKVIEFNDWYMQKKKQETTIIAEHVVVLLLFIFWKELIIYGKTD
jgi:hypothetical protein